MGVNSKLLTDLMKKNVRLYFDGAMGTVLMEKNAPQTNELITEIHSEYLNAGCNIVTTNTFNVNKANFTDYDMRIKDAIESARNAVNGRENTFVAFDVCPLGRLIEPLGNVSFDDAVDIFSENVILAEKYGADLILVETMTDLKEACAAVIAAKKTSLPVFVTCAFSENGHLMTGATPYEVVKELEAIGVDAVGVNCSYGPDKMIPVIEQLVKYASVPVVVNPNAGLPEIKDGKSVYSIDADVFSDYMVKIANLGAGILGGCCGTTPEYIKKTVEKTKNISYTYPQKKDLSSMSDDMKVELSTDNDLSHPLIIAILEGENEDAVEETEKLLGSCSPLDVINNYIIPALDKVGAGFGSGELFLSELMMSAETASEAFKVLKANMTVDDAHSKGSIIIATVKGDVHDIGKDIVKVLLESYGFNIYDLGIDVAPEKILDEVNRTGCRLVGLSALMTTTIPAMEATINLLHNADKEISVIAGSAVLNETTAREIGADYYAKDAMATVNIAIDYYNK